MDESFIDIREEMELIKTRQQELLAEGSYGHEREMWRLQIVWDYLRDKYLIPTKGNGGQLH
jgi:hypothetical protein